MITINNCSTIGPPGTMTLSAWIRPRSLGSGYIVAKSGSFYFPQIESNGSIDAKLQLSSSTGPVIVNVSSASLSNLWSYFVMTCDGSNINVYVNGQLWNSRNSEKSR